jgi:3-oxoacid CoA-transferase subunit B
MWTKDQMAIKVSNLISNNSTVNLGIGLPTLVAEKIDNNKNVYIHSENGVLGVEGRPKKGKSSSTLINAGKQTISIKKGASFFDSSLSFGMIRGGHIDYSILGGMQVDIKGNLANWMIPGKKITGMGGAMDLVSGSKNIIVMMDHYTKDKSSKLIKNCNLPLTGVSVVDIVVTNLGVFEVDKLNNYFKIIELSGDYKLELMNTRLFK